MISFIIIVAIVAFLISRIHFRKYYLGLKIPGPRPLPIVGNGLLFLNIIFSEKLRLLDNLTKRYGDYYALWASKNLIVVLQNPKDLEVILSSSKFIEKTEIYHVAKPWLREGLLLSNGSKWFQRRKMLTPAFHFRILEQFVEVFDRQSDVFIEILSQKGRDKVEIMPLALLLTLDVLAETAMGARVNAQRTSNSDYVLAVKKVTNTLVARATNVFIYDDLMFRFSSLYKGHKKAIKFLHDFTDKVIREKRNNILTNGNDAKPSQEGDESFGRKKKNFIDILLESNIDGEPLSDADIREEVDTFLFAGHDTTAFGITFGLYNIAKHPEVQSKCFQEIREVIGDDRTKPVSYNDLTNLRYLDLVIKESLRLFPSATVIGRKLREETTVGEYTLPEGAEVLIPIFLLGKNPKHFKNPEQFLPERFLTESTTDEQNPFAYIPFSAGPRNCIGQKFAILELKMALSKVLRNFEIELTEDKYGYLTPTSDILENPQNKIKIYLKPRVY